MKKLTTSSLSHSIGCKQRILRRVTGVPFTSLMTFNGKRSSGAVVLVTRVCVKGLAGVDG